MVTNFKEVQAQNFSLSGAGASAGATTVTLKSFLGIDGVTPLTITDFGSIGYATLEPGNGTQEEQISFSGVTQNANGTATLTGVKNVLFISPYTETSGTSKTHAGSTTLVISNTSGFYNQFPAKANDETITGQWTFNTFPITPSNSVATNLVAGITKLSVAAASATGPIAVGTNDGRVPVAYAVDSVGTDSYAITPSPAETAYVTGKEYTFQAGTSNTGAATLNVSGLGAKSIVKNVSQALDTGDILANQIVVCKYDGTNMQMVSLKPANPIPVIHTYTGPATWSKPTGLSYLTVEMVGAGGAGGGASGSTVGGGGGGGAGGYARRMITSGTLGATAGVTVGATGASVFGTFLSASPGADASKYSSSYTTGGLGGTASNGDINITGGDGGNALLTDGATNSVLGGIGGGSYFGGGGVAGVSSSGGQNGTAARPYGAGGGGAASQSSNASTGGAGASGLVILTEYYL